MPVLGYSVAIGCLIWVYRGFDWKSELPRLAATDWRWVSLAVVADILVYVCQGFRWSALLSPLGRVSSWKTMQAIYIGLFANEVLPFRSGEVIRCYLLRKWSDISLGLVISSVVIERLLDGILIVLAFRLVGYYIDLPGYLLVGSQALMGVLVVASVLLVAAMLYRPEARRAVAGSGWTRWLRPLVDGVHSMGDSRSFVVAAFLSLVYFVLQILPVYFLMKAYGLDLTPWAALVVLVILRLGTVLPQAPGNVGSFQALTVVGLKILGYERGEATGFATLLFLVVTVPLWLAGFVALMMTRMRLTEIHRDARESLEHSR